MVEAAVVYPVFLLLVVGGLSLGLGLFRYQELSYLARESARWASLQDAPPSAAQVLTSVVQPRAAGIDPTALTITPSFSGGVTRVTISYLWTPEAFFAPITLRSTALSRIPYR